MVKGGASFPKYRRANFPIRGRANFQEGSLGSVISGPIRVNVSFLVREGSSPQKSEGQSQLTIALILQYVSTYGSHGPLW